NRSAYSASSGITIVKPRTSTRTIRKIGRSGDFLLTSGDSMAARTAAGKSPGRRDTLTVMGTSSRALAALMACALLLGGCFGYNKSAKRWAYVGDTVLLLGG